MNQQQKDLALKLLASTFTNGREATLYEVMDICEWLNVRMSDELREEANRLGRIRTEASHAKQARKVLEMVEALQEGARFKAPHGNEIVEYTLTVEVYPDMDVKVYKGRERFARVERRWRNQISGQSLKRAYTKTAPRVFLTMEINGKKVWSYEFEERGAKA